MRRAALAVRYHGLKLRRNPSPLKASMTDEESRQTH